MNPNDDDATNAFPKVPIESGAYSASLSMADVNLMEKGTSSTRSIHSDTLVDVSEHSASLPAAEEVRNSTALTSPRHRNNTKKFAWMCLIPLVIVATVALALGLKKSDGNDRSSSGNSDTTASDPKPPTTSPVEPAPAPHLSTFAPTNKAVDQRATLHELMSWFISQNISSSDALATGGSPQNRAALWLAYQDGAALPLPRVSIYDSTTSEGYLYMVRYVMVVLYYQMQGDSWSTNVNFMTSRYVCDWNAISWRTNNGINKYPELGGLECDADTGMPVSLDLEFNELQGAIPTELGLIDTLVVLDMEYNNITGHIAEELCNLSSLQYLSLKVNMLGGEIPQCLHQWTNLEYLNLRDNNLSGMLPSSPALCDLVNMETIVLDRNFVTGSIPECVGRWPKLQLLSLADNLFTGSVPTVLSQLDDLTELYLDGNHFEGNPISVINKLVQLRLVYIEQNLFTGAIDDKFVKDLTQLWALDISANKFTSSMSQGFPAHLFELPKLSIVDFSQNELQGSLPTDVPRNSKLRFLSVYDNLLGGEIPSQLSNLVGLWHLDLSDNEFDGSIPPQLFEMPKLVYFFLSENPRLQQGPIPSSVANMTQLKELSMKNTNRTGPLPLFLDFEDLFLLDLDNNKFAGTIPPSYGRLPLLRHLLLNRNSLSGMLPVFNETTNLGTVLLDKTNVTGDFSSICNLPTFTGELQIADNVMVVADCSDEDSGISCSCCYCCYRQQETCSDPLVASLDWTWEHEFRRTARDFAINASVLNAPNAS